MTTVEMVHQELRNARILVVDDDPVMRDFVESLLKSLHVRDVRVCADGYSALKLLPSFTPSVIVTDIHMKPIGGIEFVRQLRANLNPVRRAIPVVFMSSDSSPETLKSALPLGACGYIVKPPCLETLCLKIVQALHSNH